jgi:uncharacterized damage-inducible protein DinB
MVGDLVDPRRREPATQLPEREMLEGWLEYHRATLLLKCEGLDDADRKRQPLATSKLSLHGLVRHMAEVERSWFQRTFGSDPEVPYLYFVSPEDEDTDFSPLDAADWATDLDTWQQECEASRRAAAGHGLDEVGTRATHHPFSLRWIYLHMIEEYARHNGHADLIREIVDGAVGC